jgi:DNA-binding LacI/PurR family transcriptional regulator
MTPTVRTLARSLGLSAATVSNALNHRGRIAASTVQRVKEAAAAAGYVHNPLAGNLMSALRRSRGGTFHGVIAAIEINEPDREPHGVFHEELLRGAAVRALELGFKVELFVAGRGDITLPRLDSILKSRGIRGVMLLPAWYAPNYLELDWRHYAGIYMDYNIQKPPLHCVCCNHYRSMLDILERVTARGYRRPGLFLEQGRNERLQRRWGSAFLGFQHGRPDIKAVPLKIVPAFRRETFIAWFKRHRPDVVISHQTDPIDWMESCGARVPETHGYVCLNILRKKRPTAGLDQQPQELGARAVESVVAQLQRNEHGIPACRTTTTISALWKEGPTLRPQRIAII